MVGHRFHWLLGEGMRAVVKLLLAVVVCRSRLDQDRYCRTPLSYAAENGHEAVIKLLLAMRASMLTGGITMVGRRCHWLLEGAHETVVELLLATYGVDADSKDSDGRSPLSWTAENGDEAIVTLIASNGWR